MWRVTVKGLLAHKLRLVLTGISVVLGVAFIAGTYVLTDTIKGSFDDLFTEINKGIDLNVRAQTTFGNPAETGGAPVNEDLLPVVQSIEGVAAAEGGVFGPATILEPDGNAIQRQAPTFGGSVSPDSDLSSVTLRDGRLPQGSDEAVIDRATFDDYFDDFREGDAIREDARIRVVTPTGPDDFRLVGTIGFGDADNLLGATFVGWDLPAAQQVMGREGEYDTITVRVEDGVDVATVQAAIQTAIDQFAAQTPDPTDGFEVVTGQQSADEQQSSVDQFLDFFNRFLLAFGLIAVFVATFIIYNTFSIIVTQRTREMALLRSLGASRGQVLGSVLAEAIVVGLVASAVGILGGVLFAAVLRAVFGAIGIDIPGGSITVEPRTVVIGLVVGLGATLFASMFPAWRASRVAPVAGMHGMGAPSRRGARNRVIVGIVMIALGVWLVVSAIQGDLVLLLPGAPLVLLGVALAVLPLVRPIAGFLGTVPARLRGVAGLLARENSKRSARRTAATASALMIGLALVTTAFILSDSANASVAKQIEEDFLADFTVQVEESGGFAPIPAALVDDLRDLPSAGEVYAVYGLDDTGRFEVQQDGGSFDERTLVGVDVGAIDRAFRLGVLEGDPESLRDGGFFVHEEVAADEGWEVGTQLTVRFPAVGEQQVAVEGIYEEDRTAGNVVTSTEGWLRYLPGRDQPSIAAVLVDDEADPATLLADAGPTVLIRVADSAGLDVAETFTAAGGDVAALRQAAEEFVRATPDLAAFADSIVDRLQGAPVDDILDSATGVGADTDQLLTDAGVDVETLRTIVVDAEPAVTDVARGQIDELLARDYPNVEALDNQELREQTEEQIGQFLNFLVVLLVFSIFIALIGVANTLALSVYERTRELGLLRAVGMSRRQLRTMVRWEAVIIAVFGAVLGVVVGLFFGWVVVRAFDDSDSFRLTELSVPVPSILVMVVITGLAAAIAAYIPARRAAKLNILEAIAHE